MTVTPNETPASVAASGPTPNGRCTPEPVREDFIDFPTGWRIQREGVEHVDPKCSAVQGNGAFLCDCGAIETEWKRRVAAQQLARGEVLVSESWDPTLPPEVE